MIRIDRGSPVAATLGATLSRLAPGDGVRVVEISTPSDLYLVLDDELLDGASVPATARFLIPGGVLFPLELTGARALLAAVSGSVDATFLGLEGRSVRSA